ncbi:D12 class N6 adenine-specific DNA methyltransferase [Trichormus variabilis ATCC 29413]|uniref:site-specific DNA-methyltransferase (adenine-specific) n=2 Tax=Anabaena variabilis TaxID=264691 RepID=Q3M4T1_TRIV2|nr:MULTISPECIES: DNA adenine methylase [Nostocaceae]ABA24005.1 D12 class N6 adenine-specific DNA methyltransferase [Trichormus variabilis ATCC 29413]MBC1216736.1 DNA adenine methylase [Trichormus variabilis ARAD]MBC1253870.1 DNA adenine methylase [Trichormus variabilis V5]MBC1269155.1 DNA adenine methylase [Trichormus variabilis FSR]MBC1304991.1 DNA adenine methylase [Trichormus variabilis N2B]
MLKSPLRYPGGKSKAIKQIIEYLPTSFHEYREPFVGGGSVFIYLKQKFPTLKIWINDLNTELFLFWRFAQSNLPELVQEIRRFKDRYQDGKSLFLELTTVDVTSLSDFDRAVRFFILNRITFSGTVESGGFSQQAFQKRFTYSSIERLEKLADILTEDIKITNLDYSQLLNSEQNDVFIFLDPPYFSATKSRLYGKIGDLHTSFEHQRFAELLQQCPHRWLITYDNSPEIRANFLSAHIYEWELQYGMNNYKQSGAAKGQELFISNYEIKHNSHKMAKNQQNL